MASMLDEGYRSLQNSHIKVLVAAGTLDRAETTLFRKLADRGVALQLLRMPLSNGHRSLFDDGAIPETEVVFRHRFDRKAIQFLRERFRQDPPDIVHCATNRALSCTLLASRGLSHRILAYRGTVGHLSFLDPTSWFAYLNPRIDRIWCVSEAVRQYLLTRRLPAERLVTIHKGQPLDSLREEPDPPPPGDFGIPREAFVVLFVGRIRPVKGVDVLVRAISLLPRELNAHLLLVGQVSDASVPRQVRRLGLSDRVHFTGPRRDAAAMPRQAHVAVMPSIEREGLSRAIIEAMAASVPVVVTNVGGLPELVDDGISGLVVPPRDAQALAQAIRDLAEHPEKRRTLGEGGCRRVENDFTIEHTVKQVNSLYQEMTSLPPR